MRAYVVGRLLQTLLVVVGISMIAFTITYILGDPLAVLLPLDAPQETRDLYRHELGLDEPLPVQYYHFVSRAITGHFGYSYVVHKPAYTLIMERMPATILLTMSGLVVAMVIALPLGILAAYQRSSWIDTLSSMIAVAGSAMPISLARADVDHLVRGAAEVASRIGIWRFERPVLPAFTLGVFLAPITMRLIRSGMIDVLSQTTSAWHGPKDWLNFESSPDARYAM